MVSPTPHVTVDAGALIVAVGALSLMVMTWLSTADVPAESVTLSRTVYTPCAVYVKEGSTAVESSN